MKLSIVIPVFNEEANLTLLVSRLNAVVQRCGIEHELLFVDDGSTDGTLDRLRALASTDPRVRYLSFSRNFGHEIAVAAGLDHAPDADAVVLMDADLQDPPELIEQMVARWRAGAHVVYAQRRRRRDPMMKRLAIFSFYRLLGRISEVEIPLDTGNFRLIDKRVAQVVRSCRENPRFVRGLVPWAGFRQEAIPFDRDARHAGKTGYGYFKLMRLALDGICAFSLAPLRLSAWLGGAVLLLSVLGATFVVVEKIFFNSPNVPRGFAFLACALFFLAGVQLFMLGMLATYVGHIFKNVQQRPMYVLAEQGGFPSPQTQPPTAGHARVVVVANRPPPVPLPPTA